MQIALWVDPARQFHKRRIRALGTVLVALLLAGCSSVQPGSPPKK